MELVERERVEDLAPGVGGPAVPQAVEPLLHERVGHGASAAEATPGGRPSRGEREARRPQELGVRVGGDPLQHVVPEDAEPGERGGRRAADRDR